MSTRSLIGYSTNEGYKLAYIHSDGYPSFRGEYLLEHYPNGSSLESIMELVDLGDRSTIYHPDDERYGLPKKYRSFQREYPYSDQYYSKMNVKTIIELNEVVEDSDLEYVYIYEVGECRWVMYQVILCEDGRTNTVNGYEYRLRELSDAHDLAEFMAKREAA